MQNLNMIYICIYIILNLCCLNKYFSNEDDDEDSCCCCKWCEDCYKKKITQNNTNKQKSEINNNDKKENKDENKEEKEEEEEKEKEEEKIPKEFTNTKTLSDHTDKVTAITQLKSGKLATGGYDNKIRIWDINDKEKTTADKIIKEN